MADPAQIDIIADRNVAFISNYSFLAVDWTGSTFKMQVRASRDTTGTALLTATSGGGSIVLFYAGTATVSVHIAAGRLLDAPEGYELTDNLLLSQISIGINATAMESFPFPEERGDDWQGWYDIIRTPASGDAELIMRGSFTVRAGVTIP